MSKHSDLTNHKRHTDHRLAELRQSQIGKVFGYWTVVGFDQAKNNRSYYWCRCICGKVRSVSMKSLQTGKSTNCNCLRYVKIQIGVVFGRLTVTKVLDYTNARGSRLLECSCSCGNTWVGPVVELTRKDMRAVRSCGCVSREKSSKQMLEQHQKLRVSRGNAPDAPLTETLALLRTTPEAIQAKMQVLERDSYTCQLCMDAEKKDLVVHHVTKVSDNHGVVADPSHMITLCEDCHRDAHNGGDWKGPVCPELKRYFYMVIHEREGYESQILERVTQKH